MKSTFLLLACLTIASISKAQISSSVVKEKQIGKVRRVGIDCVTLSMRIGEKDTTYFFHFINFMPGCSDAYQNVSINFIGSQAVDSLYSLMVESADKPKGESIECTLGGYQLLFRPKKADGRKIMYISFPDGYSCDLAGKDLKKLFGKM